MHHKNIRLIIRKQLKKQYPNWKRLNKKTKKEIARKVLAEVTAEYDFNHEIQAPREELLGIEQQIPTERGLVIQTMHRADQQHTVWGWADHRSWDEWLLKKIHGCMARGLPMMLFLQPTL